MFTLQKRQQSDVDEMGELVVSWQWRWMWRWSLRSSRCATVQLCTGLHHLAKLHCALNLCITWPIALLLDICTAYLALDFTLDTGTHCHLQLFICHFSFTHFDVKLPVLSFFRSRFGHKIQLFILGSIKILIFTFRQHSTL